MEKLRKIQELPVKDSTGDLLWPCSWDEHELVELREGMRMTFLEKMRWLEQATEFAERLEAAPQTTRPSAEG